MGLNMNVYGEHPKNLWWCVWIRLIAGRKIQSVGFNMNVYGVKHEQGYLVFGSDLGFRSQMLRFSRNIASTARSYSGKMFTHIK